jgi:hypothetical protein
MDFSGIVDSFIHSMHFICTNFYLVRYFVFFKSKQHIAIKYNPLNLQLPMLNDLKGLQ